MNQRRSLFTVETLLVAAIFGLALWLRLYQLNTHPLADSEAREALTVFRWLFQNIATTAPNSPAYFFFTYLSFLLFDASNATARFAPALFGALLTLVPLLSRPALDRGAALLASVLLAVSTTLVAASRAADGTTIAIAAFGAGIGALYQYRVTGARGWLAGGAAALGVGLATGAAFVTGVAALLAAALVVSWTNPGERGVPRDAWRSTAGSRGLILLIAGGALLLVATVALTYRAGLGALGASWARWLTAWLPQPAGRTPQILLVFLAVGEPLGIVFGLVGGWLAFSRGNRLAQWLVWFALMGLTLVLIRGGRAAADLVWVAAPLALLSAWALSTLSADLLSLPDEDRSILAAQVVVILTLLGFALMNTASFAEKVRVDPALLQEQIDFSGLTIPVSPVAYLAMSLVALVLVGLTTYLIGMGWSRRVAAHGLTLGVALLLGVMGVRTLWAATQLGADSPAQLWWAQPVADDLDRLEATAATVSNFAVGSEHELDVTVQADPQGALAWAFREFPRATFVDALGAEMTSSVVVAPATVDNPTLGSAYVGQDFVYRRTWTPALTWPGWIAWLAYRRAPVEAEHVILWVRQDVAQLQTAQ